MNAIAPASRAPSSVLALALSAAALAAAATLGLGGCAERAPPVPVPDAAAVSPSRDGGGAADAGEALRPGRGDGGPALPPADLEIVLPYLGETVHEELSVTGEVGAMDVFFSIDTTGSFSGEIDNLQAQLRSGVLPSLRRRVDDLAVGVGRFEDFPLTPFGQPADLPFRRVSPITTHFTRVASAVASLDQPLGHGGDGPESGAEALYQIATGAGLEPYVPEATGLPALGGGELGGVGFRADSLRVVVHVTDAPTHEPVDYGPAVEGAHGTGEAIAALSELGVRVLGISSGDGARPYLEAVASGTGSVVEVDERGLCRTGVDGSARPPTGGRCPLVFDVRPDGSGLSGTVVDAIANLLSAVRYDEVWAESDDRLGFVRHLEAAEAEPPAGAEQPGRADLRPAGDGVADTFLQVRPGTRLSFTAALRNETIPPADYDQIFNLTLRVLGDGVLLLRRRVRVIVPRGRLDGGAFPSSDAGPSDAGPSDAGRGDAGPGDAGPGDAGPGDAGPGDAGPGDAAMEDAAMEDAAMEDAGVGRDGA